MHDFVFTRKDPEKGYLTNQLLVPRGILNEASIEDALTFYIGEEDVLDDDGTVLRSQPKKHSMWDRTRSHMVLPRAFFDRKTRDEFSRLYGVEWIEERLESKELSLPNSITPRDDTQHAALAAMRQHGGGTVNLACGKGKTIVALKYWADLGRPAIVVVNSAALADQWMRKIRYFLHEDINIGLVQGQSRVWKDCPIVIATVQTLANHRDNWPMEFRRNFGVVFFDEGHHMAAPHFVKAADLFYGQRFSLTATAFRTDGLEAISMYHIGDIIYQDLTQELIPETIFHQTNWEMTFEQEYGRRVEYIDSTGKARHRIEGGAKDKSGKVHHRKFCIELGKVGWRNELIMHYLEEDMLEGRQVLLLTHSVEHTRVLAGMAQQRWSTAGMINGSDVDPFDRIPILEECNPVIGTFDLGREALDKDVLDTLHVLTPFGNSNDLQQAWGRIQRRKQGKNDARVRVYEDHIRLQGLSSSGKRREIKMAATQCRTLKKFLKALKYPAVTRKEMT